MEWFGLYYEQRNFKAESMYLYEKTIYIILSILLYTFTDKSAHPF